MGKWETGKVQTNEDAKTLPGGKSGFVTGKVGEITRLRVKSKVVEHSILGAPLFCDPEDPLVAVIGEFLGVWEFDTDVGGETGAAIGITAEEQR